MSAISLPPIQHVSYILSGSLRAEIEEKLSKSQVVVLGGMLGSGKTKAACAFAHYFLDQAPVVGKRRVLWIKKDAQELQNRKFQHPRLKESPKDWSKTASQISAQVNNKEDPKEWLIVSKMIIKDSKQRDEQIDNLRLTSAKIIIITSSKELWDSYPYVDVEDFESKAVDFFKGLLGSQIRPTDSDLTQLTEALGSNYFAIKKVAPLVLQHGIKKISIDPKLLEKIFEDFKKKIGELNENSKKLIGLFCLLNQEEIPDFLLDNDGLYAGAKTLVDRHFLSRFEGFYALNPFFRKAMEGQFPIFKDDWFTSFETSLKRKLKDKDSISLDRLKVFVTGLKKKNQDKKFDDLLASIEKAQAALPPEKVNSEVKKKKLDYAKWHIYKELSVQIHAVLAKASGLDQRPDRTKVVTEVVKVFGSFLPAIKITSTGPEVSIEAKAAVHELAGLINSVHETETKYKSGEIKSFFSDAQSTPLGNNFKSLLKKVAFTVVDIFSRQISRLSHQSIQKFAEFTVNRILDYVGSHKYVTTDSPEDILIQGLFGSTKDDNEKLTTEPRQGWQWTIRRFIKETGVQFKDRKYCYYKGRSIYIHPACGFRKPTPEEKIREPDPSFYKLYTPKS